MELYNKQDLELVQDNIDDIIEKIEEKKLELFEPTGKQLLEMYDIVLDFVKEKKRKIYGGYAQNKLVEQKDPKDAFYKPGSIVDIDIDFYSPDPISDIVELSDIFHNKGYKSVQGKEAFHKETYSVFVDNIITAVADISYVPTNIYNRIPFVEIKGIRYAGPSFVMMDLYKMFTEPYFSSFRWKKTFPRIYLLQKHYLFNKATSKLPKYKNNDAKLTNEQKKNKDSLMKGIYDHIKNKDSVIMVGTYAYNHLLEQSGIMKNNKLGSKYSIQDISHYEFISTDYKNDVLKLFKELQDKHPNLKDEISIAEYYPFWSLSGYSTRIYYRDSIIAHIFDYSRRCTPTKKVDAVYYEKGKSIRNKGFTQIGSFNYVLLMTLIMAFYWRVNKDDALYQYYNIMVSHLIEMRNYYLKQNNKTLLDDTVFQDFIKTCVGETSDPMRDTRLEREQKYKQGKRVIFKYDPASKQKKPEYRFPNSSGNVIRNSKNFRIIESDAKAIGIPSLPRTNLNEPVKKELSVESESSISSVSSTSS
jgi:hypothetical protein